jgi:hypothetical protein
MTDGSYSRVTTLPVIRAVSSLDELRTVIGDDAEPVWEAWWRYPSVDPNEKAVLTDIEKYDWHAVFIRGDADGPQFGYSVGFYRALGAPEVIIVGLRLEIAHAMLWQAYVRGKQGETLAPRCFYDNFLEGHPVTFVAVSQDARQEFLGFANWYYKKASFPAVQLVWPSAADGRWPWESESLARLQPLLGQAPQA